MGKRGERSRGRDGQGNQTALLGLRYLCKYLPLLIARVGTLHAIYSPDACSCPVQCTHRPRFS